MGVCNFTNLWEIIYYNMWRVIEKLKLKIQYNMKLAKEVMTVSMPKVVWNRFYEQQKIYDTYDYLILFLSSYFNETYYFKIGFHSHLWFWLNKWNIRVNGMNILSAQLKHKCWLRLLYNTTFLLWIFIPSFVGYI